MSVKHFSDEDWLDFAQGAMPTSRLPDLEKHLSECPDCARIRRFWRNVSDVARRESGNRVPQQTMLAGQAIFEDWRRRSVLENQARRARPIFDSLLHPVPAGVRAAGQLPRRVLHRLGQWIVDLRVESEMGDRVSVVGQVLKPGWPPDEAAKTKILLLSHHTLVAETDANTFGEFQFTFRGAPEDPVIFIDLHGRPAIAVSLPQPDQPVRFKRNSGVKKSENGPT